MRVAALATARQSSAPFDALFGVIASRRDISSDAKVVCAKLVTLHRTGRQLTQAEIGAETGLTRHQVWAAIQELVGAALLRVKRLGLGLPNVYTLLGVPQVDLDGRAWFRKVRLPDSGQPGSDHRRQPTAKKTAKNVTGYRPYQPPVSYAQGRQGTVPAR